MLAGKHIGAFFSSSLFLVWACGSLTKPDCIIYYHALTINTEPVATINLKPLIAEISLMCVSTADRKIKQHFRVSSELQTDRPTECPLQALIEPRALPWLHADPMRSSSR